MTALCTLFTSAKAFTGHNKRAQYNALGNWRALGFPVLLLGNDPGSAEAAAAFGCRHIPDITTTEFGTPLLSDMFEQARSAATTPIIAYINADILLPPSFCDAVRAASERWEEFLVIGQRWDVDVSEELVFDGCWPERLEALRHKRGVLHSPWGLDYFVFPRTLSFAMPPFAIGRPGWDIWLVWTLAEQGIPLLNISRGVAVLHQNHEYSHVPSGSGRSYAGPEADKNLKLYSETAPGLDPIRASTYRAEWAFTGTAIVKDTSWGRLWWHHKRKLHVLPMIRKGIATILGPERTASVKRFFRRFFAAQG